MKRVVGGGVWCGGKTGYNRIKGVGIRTSDYRIEQPKEKQHLSVFLCQVPLTGKQLKSKPYSFFSRISVTVSCQN